jgi:exodeoxyribonuclease V alpha subunit
MPITNERSGDFYLMQRDRQEDVVKLITDLCSERLTKAYGFDPIKDIQVLTPTRRGNTGVEGLNIELQRCLNPFSKGKKEKSLKNFLFRVGDKVMQIRNNYNLAWENKYDTSIEGTGVFNGDMGVIIEINNEYKYISVEFDDERIVKYEFTMLDQLEHAYAITIHKSQGSEFDAVIIPICSGPKMLYTRNLIYTAVTRAKKLVVLVGSPAVLEKMISNTNEQLRYTSLAEFLVQASKRDNLL